MEPSGYSLGDAGFLTVEVFDRDQKNSVVSLLTKLFEVNPEAPTGSSTNSPSRQTATTIDVTKWNLDNSTVERVFSDAAKTFQIDLTQLLSIYVSVRVFLIDNPTVPFLLLVILADLHPEKLDRSAIRDHLRRLSLPFRLFIEKTPGLSSQGVAWSPHVANVTWVGVTVDDHRLV